MSADAKTVVALIPARAGSKRVTAKNIRPLAGHPLIAYTIAVARASGVFSRILVSTESEEIAAIARRYGAETPYLRNALYAQDKSPDIEWVQEALSWLQAQQDLPDAFSILRPTSPFRTPEMIQNAWAKFKDSDADSLRAVEKCHEHPAKMWQIDASGQRMAPVMPNPDRHATPWHSTPYQALPPVYVQNASLEIAWTPIALTQGSIAGEAVMPFVCEGLEGFDINTIEDWILAEHHLTTGAVSLPTVEEMAAV